MKSSDDVILHVIRGLGPPVKNPGYMCTRIQKIFMFGNFPFTQSKNNAVLEPRTGHFRGLVRFETKTKAEDLNFEAKDFKMCPQGHPRG